MIEEDIDESAFADAGAGAGAPPPSRPRHVFAASTARYHDLSIAVAPWAPPAAQVQTFHLPAAAAAPFAVAPAPGGGAGFVASVDAGGSVNCAVISSLCVHSNGTHTECAGHALPGAVTLAQVAPLLCLLPALLLSAAPQPLAAAAGGALAYPPGDAEADRVVSGALLVAAFVRLAAARAAAEAAAGEAARGGGAAALERSRRVLRGFLRRGALVVRTLPNGAGKRSAQYGGTSPPFFTACAMRWALARGCEHLVMDLPSADREEDRGQLIAHRAWWGLPPAGDAAADRAARVSARTITELAFVEDAAGDGPYLLDLQVAPFDMDAAPSRPLLFPVREM